MVILDANIEAIAAYERRIAELEARVQSQDALLKKKNAEIRSLLADIGLICVHKSSGITSA